MTRSVRLSLPCFYRSSCYHLSTILVLWLQFFSSAARLTRRWSIPRPFWLITKKGLEKVLQQSGRLRAIPNGFSAAPKSQKCSEIFLFKIRQFLNNRLRVAANLFFRVRCQVTYFWIAILPETTSFSSWRKGRNTSQITLYFMLNMSKKSAPFELPVDLQSRGR